MGIVEPLCWLLLDVVAVLRLKNRKDVAWLFRLFRLLASLNYTRRTPLHALSPVIVHSRTRFVARAPSTANSHSTFKQAPRPACCFAVAGGRR